MEHAEGVAEFAFADLAASGRASEALRVAAEQEMLAPRQERFYLHMALTALVAGDDVAAQFAWARRPRDPSSQLGVPMQGLLDAMVTRQFPMALRHLMDIANHAVGALHRGLYDAVLGQLAVRYARRVAPAHQGRLPAAAEVSAALGISESIVGPALSSSCTSGKQRTGANVVAAASHGWDAAQVSFAMAS